MRNLLVWLGLMGLLFLVACQPAVAKEDTAVRGKTATNTTAQLAPEAPETIVNDLLQEDEDAEEATEETEEAESVDQTPENNAAITHGPLSGEVSATAVTLWARGNEPGTLAFTLTPIGVVFTPTVEMTETSEMTDTVGMTETVEMTDTVGMTETVEITDTVGMTETVEITDTVGMTETVEITDTVGMTETVEITDTVGMTETVEITDTVGMTETVEITDTVGMTETVEMTDTVGMTETVEITDTVDLADFYDAVVDIGPERDFTGQVRVEGLNPSTVYSYSVILLTENGASEARTGTFTTAPAEDAVAPFSFVFGGCLGGQGYCRTEEGWLIFDEMAATDPDFFLLIGDTVYVTGACLAEGGPIPGVIPGAEGPFTELNGFRTRYKYHLEDPPYASFLANTPVYVTWDDHEVMNDFSGPALQRVNPRLFAEGYQAFTEYWPNNRPAEDPTQMYRSFSYGAQADFFVLDTRSYRDPNVNWDPSPSTLTPKTMLGEAQFSWLQEELANSEATWKFIVTSVPLSYPTGFPEPEVIGRDGWANFTERSGYETELLALVFYLQTQGVENVVFLSGDTHWPYAISYDPGRTGEPSFYEFASSPLSAITLAPAQTDPTLNPTVLFAEGVFAGDTFNFGRIELAEAGDLTLNFYNASGEELYELTLAPDGE